MLAITPLFLLLIHLVTLTEGARIPGAPIPPRRSRFSRKSEVASNSTQEVVKRATDPWASQSNFNWNTWLNWGFYDHSLDYTKQWYYANYGTGLAPSVNSWQDLSAYVSYFGTSPAALTIVPCKTTFTGGEAATVYPNPRCSVAVTASAAAYSSSSLAAYSAASASTAAYSASSLAAYSSSSSAAAQAANTAAAAQASASWTAQAQGQNIRAGWAAIGCFRDSPTRVLGATYTATSTMTNGACVDYCAGNGYTYAGTQFGGECWCSSVFNGPGIWTGSTSDTYIKSGDPYGVEVDFSQCQLQSCSGDATQPCGGHWRMNTFQLVDANAYSAYQYSSSAGPSLSAYSSRAAATYSASVAAYSSSLASSASAYASAAAAYSTSSANAAASAAAAYSSAANAYSTSSANAAASAAAAYSSSSAAAASSLGAYSASVASASSRAAWSQASANAYSTSSANAYSQSSIASAASAYSQQSLAAYSQASAAAYSQASAAAYSQASLAAYSASSAAAYSQATSLAGYSASSAAAYSQASSLAAAYSQAASQYSQASLAAYSQSSAAAYSQATSLAGYSASSNAAAYSQSSAAAYSQQSLAAYSKAASAYSSAATAYSQAASAYSQSSLAASASQYSQASLAAYSQSAAAYSQASAAAYSQASLAAYSQSVAAYSQASIAAYSQASAAAYSQAAAAYSQASAAAYSQASAAAYSQASLAAYSQSAAGYSQASAAAYSQASAAAYSQASIAAYSQASAAAYSQSAAAYSQAAAVYSQSAAAAYSQASQAAYSQQSLAAYSQAASAYSQQSLAAYSQAASAYSQASAAAYSQATSLAGYSSASAASASLRAQYSSQSALQASQSALAASLQGYSQSVQQYSQSASAQQASISAYSQSVSAQQALQSAQAYSQAASQYSQSVSAQAYSQSVSAQQALQSAQAYSSAAAQSVSAQQALQSAQAYSQSVAQYSQSVSALQASQSAQAYSQSVAQLSQSIAAYSQSISAAQAYSQSVAQLSQSIAQYSQSVSAAQALQSAQAYSQSVAGYSQSVSAAQALQSAQAYSQSVAGYSQSISAAQASQSAALYSQAAAAFSQSASALAAANSAAAYSAASSISAAAASASAAAYSATSAAAYQAQQSLAAYSSAVQSLSAYSVNLNNQIASSSLNAYSAAQSLAAYSQNLNNQIASASQSAAAYSSSVSAALAQTSQALASLPSGWTVASTACIAEGTSGRALSSDSTTGGSMTWATCVSYCNGKGYPLAGVEYSGECYCGNVLSNGASLNIPSTSCNMPCSGAPGVICGGPSALNLFTKTSALSTLSSDLTQSLVSAVASTVPSPSPVSLTLPSGWSAASSIGIAEGTTGRALQGASTTSPSMTVPQCLTFCQGKGFQYAGLEYSSECYCGSALVGGASLSLTSPNCNMPCSGQAGTICGGPSCLSIYVNPSLAVASTSSSPVAAPTAILPSGWSVTSVGIAEGSSGRALQGASTTSSSMTPTLCANFCASKGFPYAGVEYSSECYCGSVLAGGASLSLTSPNANMPCSGDATQICGGPSTLTLFYNPSLVNSVVSSAAPATSSAAVQIKLPSGWSVGSTSCIQEVNGRALTGASTFGSSMTLESCLNFCSSKGFALAGIEYGQECYCGSSLVNGASLSSASSSCNMPCPGNSAEICGGPNAIQLFSNPNVVQSVASSATSSATPAATSAITINGYTSSGCLQEVAGRALTGARKVDPGMTIEMCTGYCSGLGYQLMAVEYGSECYCGNTFSNGASLSLVSGQCNMPCPGNSAEMCGGPNALQYFVNPNAVAPSSSAAPSSTSSQVPAATVALPSGWSIASTPCLLEATTGGRALAAASTSSPQMTIPICLNYCQGQGYQYAGLEYSSECYCSNGFNNGASLSIPATQCNMQCSGDSTSICGGPDSISLFNNPSLAQAASASPSPSPSPSPAASCASPSPIVASVSASSSTLSAPAASSSTAAPSVNGFASKGCIQEVAGRALNSDRYDDPAMTIDKCTSYCSSKGYSMAGVEYGQECYCSNTLSGGASTSLVSGQCYMSCPGNSAQLCGGPNAIELYQLGN